MYLVTNTDLTAKLTRGPKISLKARRSLTARLAIARVRHLVVSNGVLLMILFGANNTASPAVMALAVPFEMNALHLAGDTALAAPVGLHLVAVDERMAILDLVGSDLATLVADPSLGQRRKERVLLLAVFGALLVLATSLGLLVVMIMLAVMSRHQ